MIWSSTPSSPRAQSVRNIRRLRYTQSIRKRSVTTWGTEFARNWEERCRISENIKMEVDIDTAHEYFLSGSESHKKGNISRRRLEPAVDLYSIKTANDDAEPTWKMISTWTIWEYTAVVRNTFKYYCRLCVSLVATWICNLTAWWRESGKDIRWLNNT